MVVRRFCGRRLDCFSGNKPGDRGDPGGALTESLT